MTHPALIALVVLAVAHIACDVYGVPMGKQVRWLFAPFVWLIYGVTLRRVDFRKCAACKEREAYINKIFGEHNIEDK